MSSPNTISFLLAFCLLGCLGCSGPEEGVYTGKIGNKKEVTIRIKTDGLVELEGYWKQPLQGGHDQGSLRGKDMDALVFEGPESKKFKLRFLYASPLCDTPLRLRITRKFRIKIIFVHKTHRQL